MNKEGKMIVFDLNGTLVARVKHGKGAILKLREPEKVMKNGDLVYVRPYLKELVEFLHSNKVQYMLWTTAEEHNAVQMIDVVKRHGIDRFIGIFTHKDSTPLTTHPHKRGKRLELVSRKFGVELSNVFLVDDHDYKCIPLDRHLPVCTYDPHDSEDKGLLNVLEQIRARLRE
jgi:NLI interacting factor-like phosphatase